MSRAESTFKEQSLVRDVRTRSTASYQILAACVIAVTGILVAYFLNSAARAPVPAATETGRVYGLIGTLLMAFLALYGARRYAYHSRMLRLEWWYRAHLLAGVAALTLLGCHCGFAMRSPFLTALQIGFWGSVVTGLFGWAYQSALRGWMVRHEYRPTILRELDQSLARARAELDREVQTLGAEAMASGTISVNTLVQHVLERMRRARLRHLWRFPDHRFWQRQVTALLQKFGLTDLPPDVQAIIVELNSLEALRVYHVWLRCWTTLHFLFTFVAVELMLWHLWMVASHPR